MIDGAGVAVIVAGLLFATIVFGWSLYRKAARAGSYRVYRQDVGKAMAPEPMPDSAKPEWMRNHNNAAAAGAS